MTTGEATGQMADPLEGSAHIVGVPESFAVFYRRERRRMVALAFAFTGRGLAAEDIAQEAMLAAFRHWDVVGRLDDPAAWVRKVTVNGSRSRFRRAKAEAKALARAAVMGRWNPVPKLPPASIELWSEVRRLPPRQAECIGLYYIAGLTMAEIAGTLGCSKETVNTHLRRARTTLSQRLGLEDDQP